MNNIWKFPCWPTRNNYIQRKVATPLASSQLHRGNREEDFPPECYAYHALLVFYVSTYICFRLLLYFQKNKKEWRIYEEVCFRFLILPCISRCRLAFGAMDLSFLNFIWAKNIFPFFTRRSKWYVKNWIICISIFMQEIHIFCKYHLFYICIFPFALRIFKYWRKDNTLKWNLKKIWFLCLIELIWFFSSQRIDSFN